MNDNWECESHYNILYLEIPFQKRGGTEIESLESGSLSTRRMKLFPHLSSQNFS